MSAHKNLDWVFFRFLSSFHHLFLDTFLSVSYLLIPFLVYLVLYIFKISKALVCLLKVIGLYVWCSLTIFMDHVSPSIFQSFQRLSDGYFLVFEGLYFNYNQDIAGEISFSLLVFFFHIGDLVFFSWVQTIDERYGLWQLALVFVWWRALSVSYVVSFCITLISIQIAVPDSYWILFSYLYMWS